MYHNYLQNSLHAFHTKVHSDPYKGTDNKTWGTESGRDVRTHAPERARARTHTHTHTHTHTYTHTVVPLSLQFQYQGHKNHKYVIVTIFILKTEYTEQINNKTNKTTHLTVWEVTIFCSAERQHDEWNVQDVVRSGNGKILKEKLRKTTIKQCEDYWSPSRVSNSQIPKSEAGILCTGAEEAAGGSFHRGGALRFIIKSV
jgi:hypothetical protein